MLLSETTPSGLFFGLVPLIVFAPLVGMMINIIFGKRLGEKGVGAVASLASGAAFLVSVLLAVSLGQHHEGAIVKIAEWMYIGTSSTGSGPALALDWAFRVDTLSVTMMLVVSGVGTLIHIYAIGYMHEDVRFKNDVGRYNRFFVFLNLFIAAMMILVSGDNYLMLFVGWEGVGLCSFLLIGFWYDMDTLGRPSWANSNAAKKAFITNRVGDFGFLIAGFLIFWNIGSFQFDAVFLGAPELASTHPEILLAITVFMLIGVAGKSAQIPLYVWLPDAMAGPTPVSALIHAATMVTAGVYLIARSAPIFSLSHDAQYIVATLGAATALFAATIAVGQYDIKKVLAYSTISQLGFMVAAVGMGAYVAGMFHLVTHAFFKALLFLSAGSVILGLERGHHHAAHRHGHDSHADGHHEETFDPGDMRNMGGLRKQMPVTFWVYMIGTLALAGIFPFAGFWSKDEILLDAKLHFPHVYWILTAAAFLTAFYMGRQVWMVFFGEARHEAATHAEESPLVITVPLMILAALSALGGFINLPFSGLHQFGHWLEHTSWFGEIEFLSFDFVVAGLSTLLALAAIGLSWFLYMRKPLETGQADPLAKPLGPAFVGMENKWFIDEAYQFVFIRPYAKLSQFLAQTIDWDFWHEWMHDSVIANNFVGLTRFLADPLDMGVVDKISTLLADWVRETSETLREMQTGFVRHYALSVLVGAVAILGYLLLK
ncbi:MAG: NADH-quinone oxidoreductase subunit L [Chloroflexi bacterium HGW-Chloroflexi-6]|nr:MAG: NADH-quinone oxidoreductase subunit L [Chloroflexi bacterium HGW-Chloroflexi-6]